MQKIALWKNLFSRLAAGLCMIVMGMHASISNCRDKHLATTATSVIEGDKVKIDPMITGFEGSEDYKQRLPVKYNGLIGYMDGYHSAYLQGFHSYGATLVHLGYQYQKSDSAYKIKLYPIQKAVGLEYIHSIFNIAVTSDSFDYQKSSILEMKLGISIPLM